MPRTKPTFSPRVLEEIRARVRTVHLIDQLQNYALNEPDARGRPVDLTVGQIRAIEILLRKTLPDLASVEVSGDGGGALVVNIRRFSDDPVQRPGDVCADLALGEGEGRSNPDPVG